MKNIFTVAAVFLLTSCTGVLTKKDIFVGDWVLSESSPGYSNVMDMNKGKAVTIKISKGDIFYLVDYISGDKSIMPDDGTEILSKKNDPELQKFMADYKKYQLSPDKKSIYSVLFPLQFIITYNEDSNTITTPLGWFKRK